MERSCEYIEGMLVDYADGVLSEAERREVGEHLGGCESCRKMAGALERSLEVAGVIWEDGLAEVQGISVGGVRRVKGDWRRRYASVAAVIAVVFGASLIWLGNSGQPRRGLTVEEIERSVSEAGGAARLLAATERVAQYPGAQVFARQQYRYIVERYSQTAAAAEARRRMQ